MVRVTAVVGPAVRVFPQTVTVVEGDNIFLTCNTSGIPSPLIRWVRIGQSGVVSQNSSLTVVNVSRPGTPDSMVQYQCTASNGVGSPAVDVANVTVHYAPEIVVAPLNTTTIEGRSAVLFCNATGSPKPNVTWSKGGSNTTLSSSEELILGNLTRSHCGTKYKCIITNYLGSVEASTIVTVYYPAVVAYSPLNQTVLEGTNVTLHCNASGKPTPNITWTKDGSQAVLFQGDIYGFVNVQRLNAGDYTCSAWNGVGRQSNATATVNVQYESVIDKGPFNRTVVEGDNITFSCNATGNPTPNITWTKVGSSRLLYQGKTYSIYNIQRETAGDYACTAWNGVGKKSHASATVIVHYGSTIDQKISSVVVIEGNNVTIKCNATGNPPPNITWIKDISPLVFYQGESYDIVNIDRNSAGNYTCTAWNGVGEKANATAAVTVHYESAIDLALSNITVVEGDNVTLHCNATGIPTPNITWTKDSNLTVIHQGETYNVADIERKAAGDYTCRAWNGVGKQANATASVTVHYKSVLDMSLSNVTAVEGDNVTLRCNATGNPAPNITWNKKGNPEVLYQGETYSIANIRRTAGGDYSCTAWNGVGKKVSASASVTVHYPPSISGLPPNTVIQEGKNVTLYCNVTGNPSPKITWTKDGSVKVLSEAERFIILNVTRQQAGDYVCTARNGMGTSANTTLMLTVHYPSSVGTRPINQTVMEGQNVTLHCNATGNPAPNITWTKDGNAVVLYQGETYTIYNIQREAAGGYTCTAWNGVDDQTNATTSITVYYPAVIHQAPSNQTVLEYSNITLVCNATSNPPSNIVWTQNENSTILHQGNAFIIRNVTRNFNGKRYKCTTVNNVTEDAYSYAVVTVLYPPEVSVMSPNRVLEGDNVSLICNVSGNPHPNVAWVRARDNSVLINDSKALLTNINRTESGVFHCLAWNGIGANASSNICIDVLYPPEIVTPPVDQVVWVGQQVNLSCDAVGNPTPKIVYTVIGDNGIVGFEKTLVINSSSTPYMKTFTCNANNTIGPVAAANATVTVLARPCAQNPCLKGSCIDVIIGTYLCNCSYGYQGANCDQAIPPKTDVVDGLITLKKDRYIYHPDYQNQSSAMFTDLSSSFCENVTVLFQGEPQFGHCKVNDIINGSVVVNFTLVFIRGNKSVDNLLQVLKESVDNGSVLAIPVERETLYLILPSTTAPPTTVQVLPPSVAARKKSMSPWIIAVLAAIGGLVFLVFICAIIHCCVLRKRKVKKRGICQRYEESTGKWIDLPQVGDGKGSDEVYGYTGPGAYIHEGPTVRVPANQENGYHSGIYERTPDEPKPSVVQFSDKANGASTEF
ncbi:Hemicentin-1 [Porites harrisoni]